jgi:hypothetical protein
MAHHLLDDTDAAIARQTLLQVASLPDRVDTAAPERHGAPRWNFEIPFATPQGTAMAQFEISRDGGGMKSRPPSGSGGRGSRSTSSPPVRFMRWYRCRRATSVRMWAERPATAAQLRAGAGAIEPGAQPRRTAARRHRDPRRRAAATAPAPAGHFLDRAL